MDDGCSKLGGDTPRALFYPPMIVDKGDGQVYRIHRSGIPMEPIVESRRLLLVSSHKESNTVVAVVAASVAGRVVLSVAMVAPAGPAAASTITPPAREGAPLPISFDLLAVGA